MIYFIVDMAFNGAGVRDTAKRQVRTVSSAT
ncbi:IS1-like element transposase [Serratia fonticola]